MNSNQHKSHQILGLLAGAAIGLSMGILFAPHKGSRTRKKLLAKADDLTDEIKVRAHCVVEEFKTKLESAANKANDFLAVEKALNASILKTTLKIQEEYPELYGYIEEMTMTIPDSDNPEISLRNLRTYNDSLNKFLSNYIKDHAKAVKSQSKIN